MRPKLKHIVFLRNPEEAPIWGGLEKLMLDWFERMDYSQCKVTLAISNDWISLFETKLQAKNIPVKVVELPLEYREGFFFKRFLNLFFSLKKLKPSSVVLIQGWLFSFDLVYVLAGFFAAPGEVYMHENLGPPMPHPKESQRYFGLIPRVGIWWHLQIWLASSRAHVSRKVVVVSKEIKEKLVSWWHYPPEKILVQYHGVDLGHYRPSAEVRSKMREALKIPPEETVMIVASRLTKVKCIHRTIEAFDALSRGCSGLTLLVLGSGPLENDLKALAQNMPCAHKIKFLGHVDNVSDYFKMSDIYALSSDNEGLGIALIEAMATGLVCVSTRCPGAGEIIRDGENGFLVEKSTEGMLSGLRKALGLSAEGRMEIGGKAARFAMENFEINARIRDAFDALGLAFANGEKAILK